MTQHVPAANRFMCAAEASDGRCLVHCQAGINRSGFLAVVQLMKSSRERLPLLEALDRCKTARGVLLLNAAFQVQLVRYAHTQRLLGPRPAVAEAAPAPASDFLSRVEAAERRDESRAPPDRRRD